MSDLSGPEKENIRQSKEYSVNKAILDFYFTKITKASPKIGPVFPPEYVYGTRYGMFRKNCTDFIERWEETKRVSKILKELKTLDFIREIPAKFRSMNKMLVYLGLVESLGVALADIVLVLLIANEKEVHTGGRFSKHATRIKELEKISLANKLDFLNGERIEIFSRLINRETRNKIAHLNFTIDEKGRITGKDNKPIKIDARINDFWKGVHTLELIFEDIGFIKFFERGISHKQS